MTIKLNFEQIRDFTKASVKERGSEYIYAKLDAYNDCMYVHRPTAYDEDMDEYIEVDGESTPGCLVGLALNKAGVPLGTLREYEGIGADEVVSRLVSEGVISFGSATDEDSACSYLYRAQTIQDRGRTWGEALAEAEEQI